MTERTRNRLIIFALWLTFYATFTLFTPALLDDADSVHAEVAREMLLRHDWVTLYANGIRYLEKAPLLYWSMAASFRVFGVSTAAARLPLALTVLALALALEAFARRAFSPEPTQANTRAGLYAALILLSSFGIFIFSRILIPDVAVCLWLTLALYAFWLTEQSSSEINSVILIERSESKDLRLDSPPTPGQAALLPCLLFAAACALNILTKGLIGLVFPLGIVLLYLLITRGWRGTLHRLRQLRPFAALATFLLIATPWHILIALANPTQGHPGNVAFTQGHWSVPLPTDGNVHGWAWFYFVNEQLLRYLNLRVPRDYDTVPLILFWGLMLVWLMPWSAFLPNAFAAALPLRTAVWRTRFSTRTLYSQERTHLFLIIWATLPLLFFSLSTRQEYYVLPSIPPLILLIAARLAVPQKNPVILSEAQRAESKDLRFAAPNFPVDFASTALIILGTLASTAALILALTAAPPSPQTDLAALLQQNPGDYALSFGHILDLNRQAMGAFRTPLLLTAIALFGGTLAHYLLRRRNQPHAATLSLAAGAFLFLLAAHLGLQTFAPVLSSQQLAAALAPHLHPEDLIVIHGEYEAASTLGFYLKRNDLHILEGRSSNLWYGSFFPDAPRIFETPTTLAAKWASPQHIYLWQSLANDPGPLPQLPTPAILLTKSGGKALYTNHALP